MDRITVRLPPDLIRRFDAAAASRGGRSRLIRRLIEGAALAEVPKDEPTTGRSVGLKLTLRLHPEDMGRLDAEAARSGLSRTQWATALIRRRLHDRPQLRPAQRIDLVEIRRELRRIGVNINQIARVLNTTSAAGGGEGRTAQLLAFQAELRLWVRAIGDGFQGDLDYWRGGA